MTTVCAVLAAGSSRRLGVPKQLLELDDGRSLVRRAAESACCSCAGRCAVVVGASAPAVTRSVADLPLELLPSQNFLEGIAGSIRAAAVWASAHRASALVLCVCDQPALSTAHLNLLIDSWQRDRCLTASYYAGKRGVPAVFPASYFGALRQLRGDVGAAALLRAAEHISLVEWPDGELDVDTPSDWVRYATSRLTA